MKKLEYYLFSGDEFRHLRKKMRFTQTEISKMIGVSLPMVNLIESGKRTLNHEAMQNFIELVKKYLHYDFSMSVETFLKIQLRDLKDEHTEN